MFGRIITVAIVLGLLGYFLFTQQYQEAGRKIYNQRSGSLSRIYNLGSSETTGDVSVSGAIVDKTGDVASNNNINILDQIYSGDQIINGAQHTGISEADIFADTSGANSQLSGNISSGSNMTGVSLFSGVGTGQDLSNTGKYNSGKCDTYFGQIDDGKYVVAYKSVIADAQNKCIYQKRYCRDGKLDGQYQYHTCYYKSDVRASQVNDNNISQYKIDVKNTNNTSTSQSNKDMQDNLKANNQKSPNSKLSDIDDSPVLDNISITDNKAGIDTNTKTNSQNNQQNIQTNKNANDAKLLQNNNSQDIVQNTALVPNNGSQLNSAGRSKKLSDPNNPRDEYRINPNTRSDSQTINNKVYTEPIADMNSVSTDNKLTMYIQNMLGIAKANTPAK